MKESGYKLSIEFCAFRALILDKIATDIVLNFLHRIGNDVCVYDNFASKFENHCLMQILKVLFCSLQI